MIKKATLLFVSALLALAATGCSTRIGPGHVGIVVQAAGSNKGVLDAPVRTGRVWYNPYSEIVIEYPTYMQTAKWTKDPNEGNPTDESITFTNKDSMAINADISLSYSLDETKVPFFYVKFKSDNLGDFTNGFLHNVARDCFNDNAGKYSVEQIMGDNAQFLKDARSCVQDKVKNYGVTLEQFGFIGAPRPPQAVIQSINMKVQAEQLGLQKQMEVQQVQADAAKNVAQAEGDAKSQIARASGEAEANRLRASSITENLLKNRALDNEHDRIWRWNGQMPSTIVGGNTGSLVQLPKE